MANRTPELITIEPEGISPDLIEVCEAMLAQARSGEISSVAFAYVFRDGSTGRRWSSPPNFATLLGAVSRLAYRLNVDKD